MSVFQVSPEATSNPVNKIINLGVVHIPQSILDHAELIKYDHYKVNTVKKFQKYTQDTIDSEILLWALGGLAGLDMSKLEYVYFSACMGAEPHIDMLDQTIFEDTTLVIPVILPSGKSIITAEDEEVVVRIGGVYQFDHTKTHSMVLEDNESGCVVVMVAVRK